MERFVRVGIGAIVERNGRVLLGKRKNAHGNGSWSFPGGHMEFGETPEEAAKREVLEETGMRVGRCRPVAFTNDFFKKENRHYITLFVLCENANGEPRVTEPEKCGGWEWFKRGHFPKPLFLPISNLLKQKKAF